MPQAERKDGMELRKQVSWIWFLRAFYVGLAIFVTVNIVNIKMPYLNEPDAHNVWTFNMVYPTGSNRVLTLGFNSIQVVARVQVDGQIIEGQPVDVSAFGFVGKDLSDKVQHVTVTFEGITHYPQAYTEEIVFSCCPPPTAVTLTKTTPIDSPIRGSTKLEGQSLKLTWPAAGDYYPIMTITMNNGTQIQQAYTDFKAHVNPVQLIQDSQANRVNSALTIALVVFGFVEGAKILSNKKD